MITNSIELTEPENPSHGVNIANEAFAKFLAGDCLNDSILQKEGYRVLIRIAWSVARKTGYIRHSSYGEYEQIAIDCVWKEVRRHRRLTIHEIVQKCDDNRFAYIWKALEADYIDELRKIRRRKEQAVDWDTPSSKLPQSLALHPGWKEMAESGPFKPGQVDGQLLPVPYPTIWTPALPMMYAHNASSRS